MASPKILHVGSGGDRLPTWVPQGEEIRLDISPECEPDIIGSIVDMGDIGEFDGVFCSHCLEHVYPHEVDIALKETFRVLKPGGWAIFVVPDLEGIQATNEVVYEAPCGPVTGIDMYYGHREFIPTRPYMAHHSGFVQSTLAAAFRAAGFGNPVVNREFCHQLLAMAVK